MSLLRESQYTPAAQRGVLYFNTVPRDMRPQEVRLHFNKYGDIRRMKFVPFPKKARRPGGPLLPLQYREGWMEFTRAVDAQHAAQCMNGQAIDVKRQRRCFGQLWTVRFLEDFTWDSLLDEAEGKRRERRAAEVEARLAERSINEAYRRMALQAQQQRQARRRHPPQEHQQSHREDREGEVVVAAASTSSAKATASGEHEGESSAPLVVRRTAAKSTVATKSKRHNTSASAAKKAERDPAKAKKLKKRPAAE